MVIMMAILIDQDLDAKIFSESSLYSKRFLSNFKRSIIYNKDRKSSILSIGYQFTHEYKKIEYIDNLQLLLFLVISLMELNDRSNYIFRKIDFI